MNRQNSFQSESTGLQYKAWTYLWMLAVALFFCYFVLDVPEGREIHYAVLFNTLSYYVFVHRGQKDGE